MRWFILILMLCFAAIAATASAADEFSVMTCTNMPQDFAVIPSSLDEQPDTILYDDGLSSSFFSNLNYWVKVRFTAPANFELHEVYVLMLDGDESNANCNIYVYGPNGPVQGQALSTAVISTPLDEGWHQGDLGTVVDIASGTDFYIVVGPVPGGHENEIGYKPLFDSGTSSSRSAVCLQNNQFGTYSTNTYGDYSIRAGGVVETFVDIQSNDCFCITAAGDTSFNMLSGDALFLHTYLENAGNSDIAVYSVTWQVEGPAGAIVFAETVNGTNLTVGSTDIIPTTNTFTLLDDGEYSVACFVDTENDALLENNESLLRFYVGDTPRWFLYDDNEVPDSYTAISDGGGWGVSFTPTSYPAKVTSIRIAVNAAGNADFRIWMNTGEDGSPASEAVWSANPAVVAGWNEIVVDPPLDIFDGETFTVGHITHGANGMRQGADNDLPNQAGNLGMPNIAWQASDEGTTWFSSLSGNTCIQAYIDTSSVIQPNPTFEASVTQLTYGNVQVGTASSQTFWVHNTGTFGDLEITAYTYQPAAMSDIYLFDPYIYSVAAGDSQEVTVTFIPDELRAFTSRVFITNNSDNAPSYQILLLGTGVAQAAGDPATGLPREFALSQNYPNPFNPTTEIQFALPYDANVDLTVLNLLGQEVATLASGFQTAGIHTVSFRALDLPSGLYLYRLEAGDFSAVRKMMLLK